MKALGYAIALFLMLVLMGGALHAIWTASPALALAAGAFVVLWGAFAIVWYRVDDEYQAAGRPPYRGEDDYDPAEFDD